MPVILFEVSVLYFYSLVVQFTFFKKQFQKLDLQPTPPLPPPPPKTVTTTAKKEKKKREAT